MSDEALNSGWVRKPHTVSGTQFILKYETFGPREYADKISRMMQKISQGKPAQRAILDGIFRTNIKLVIEHAKEAQADKDPSGRVHTIKFDPDVMSGEILFQHRDTKQVKWLRVDAEEVLIHELYHPWLDGGEAQLVKIGAPSAKEKAAQKADRNSTIVAEGYTIRYLNTIREANGSRWIRLTHDERSNYKGSRLYLQLDGSGQGFPKRGHNP